MLTLNPEGLRNEIKNINVFLLTLTPKTETEELRAEVMKHKNQITNQDWEIDQIKVKVEDNLTKIETFTDSARSQFDDIQSRLLKCENKLKTLFDKQGEIVKLIKGGEQLNHSASSNTLTKEEIEKLTSLINAVKKDSEKQIA